MKEVIDKISSYNIFNYLLPGAVYAIWMSKFHGINLIETEILTAAFFYYFLGMIISRIGSLLIEPLLKALNFVSFVEHKKYVLASQKDKKLNVLSETNNMYRTFISTFALIGLSHIFLRYSEEALFINNWGLEILIVLILILFLASYRKQTKYIKDRTLANEEKQE